MHETLDRSAQMRIATFARNASDFTDVIAHATCNISDGIGF